jgi:hypothetical protein
VFKILFEFVWWRKWVSHGKEYRWRMFGNRMLRTVFGYQKGEGGRKEGGENCIMRSFII